MATLESTESPAVSKSALHYAALQIPAQSRLNNVQIIGNLGGGPEMKYVNNSDHVVNFSVAVNERWKNRNGDPQERTTWLRIVAFNGLGSACAEFLKRGDPVYVEGRLQIRE